MYLKSIEVHGFKSFANKIMFTFHDGITGIVGPNGSGKSNVADAVRWVLGEQSAKQLRGAKMEDIIFSGTETRKQMGYAYVAITLDNSSHKLPIEFDEVTVARRVYRSGESEYLINGSTCRLRDVQELFLDTGIGKEGYSIIGQGQIDKILSGKPEDRRELFDEAAGIVKFKKRKLTAERNLEEEKQNLYRINDILSEIEKQIGPLESQSVKAKEYIKFKEELKVLEVNLFLLENEKIIDEKKQVEDKLINAKKTLETANLNYNNTKEEYERLELLQEECNGTLEQFKITLSEEKLLKEKLEGEIKLLQEQILSIKQNDLHYQSRIDAIHKDIDTKTKELSIYTENKIALDSKIESYEKEQSDITLKISEIRNEISTFTKNIEECNGEIFDLLSENSSIKTSLQRYETILEQNNIKKVELNQKLIRNKSEEALIDIEIAENENQLLETDKTISKIKTENISIDAMLNQIQKELDELSFQINKKQQEYHGESSRLESLKNMTERYEGYGSSIKKVMEKKDVNKGIHGVVADIIKVENRYETAIEIALGGNIQNIVTDNETTAKELIEYLKKNKFGRATFLPLTSISSKDGSSYDKYLSEKGVIGLAHTLVEVKPLYKDLLKSLLGRSIVVDTIDNALLLAKKYNQSLRIVTLEGELLNPGGSLSGGAYKNSSNLLGRRREITELETYVASLDKELKDLEISKEEKKIEKQNAREITESNKAKLQENYIKQNTIKLKIKEEVAKKQNRQVQYEEITSEMREIDLQSKDLTYNIQALNESLTSNEYKRKENEIKIDQISLILEEKRKEETTVNELLSSVRIDFSANEQKKQNIIENIRRIKRETSVLLEEENSIKLSKESATSQIEEKNTKILSTENDINASMSHITSLESEISDLNTTIEDIAKNHKNFFKKRQEYMEEISLYDKECYRLSSILEKLDETYNDHMNYMWNEYELTYSTAILLKEESINNISVTKKHISDKKISIRNLGDVNVNAIEDFKNTSERYIFLKEQRDDLLTAEENLLGIISELDEEMRKQFLEKFGAIREQFDHVFKELFGGGKATLELTDDEDILEAGIIITSQPPGKKLQNMMQLSGGEKALTAISLLFAIQNLKPSPFCLLDEIEAALDDANVKRFAKYLNKLTKDTQFIIITHRRGTMAAADILYGITMQEKGVSTLVSVNLIENDLDK
jgi:chromosome segregation protein